MAEPESRADFAAFYPVTSRWMDNDIYGHINNVVYYAWFDAAVNRYLIEEGGLDIHGASEIGVVVHSSCDYHSPLAYPQDIEVGIRVAKPGKSSVKYYLGVFAKGDETASASGEFVHVFVRRASNKSCPIPEKIRHALKQIERN